jgi:hypothetical protein
MDSLKNVADMGCGTGEDINWWATLTTRDDPPEPHNYNCFAVDIDEAKLAQVPNLPNIRKINKDFTKPTIFPVSIDLMWSHDSLQYSHNPLETLRYWNEQMTVNGMLVLSVLQHSGVEYNRYQSRSYSGCYYHYTPVSLIYMLAVNGFDCRDAYLLKKFNDPWMHLAVYKSNVAPLDPKTATWEDLIRTNLLHPSIEASINRHGHVRQEEIVMPWLDKENYFIDYVSQWENLPGQPTDPEILGVVNTSTESKKSTIKQKSSITKDPVVLKPVGITRPPKQRFVK